MKSMTPTCHSLIRVAAVVRSGNVVHNKIQIIFCNSACLCLNSSTLTADWVIMKLHCFLILNNIQPTNLCMALGVVAWMNLVVEDFLDTSLSNPRHCIWILIWSHYFYINTVFKSSFPPNKCKVNGRKIQNSFNNFYPICNSTSIMTE